MSDLSSLSDADFLALYNNQMQPPATPADNSSYGGDVAKNFFSGVKDAGDLVNQAGDAITGNWNNIMPAKPAGPQEATLQDKLLQGLGDDPSLWNIIKTSGKNVIIGGIASQMRIKNKPGDAYSLLNDGDMAGAIEEKAADNPASKAGNAVLKPLFSPIAPLFNRAVDPALKAAGINRNNFDIAMMLGMAPKALGSLGDAVGMTAADAAPAVAVDPGTQAAVKIMADEGKSPDAIMSAAQSAADSRASGLPRTVFEESGGPVGVGVQQALTEGRSPATAQGASVLNQFNDLRNQSALPAVMKDTFQRDVSTTSPVAAAQNAIESSKDIISQASKDLTASVAPKYAAVMAKQLPPSWLKNLYDNNPSFASRFNAMKSDPDFQQLVMDNERTHGVTLAENSVGYLDTAKKYLDSAYNDSLDDFGKPTAQSKAINSARTALVTKLDTAVPSYAKARQAYGDESVPVRNLQNSLIGDLAKSTDEKQVYNTVFNDLPEKIGTARDMFNKAGKGQQWNDLVSAWISQLDDKSTGTAQSLLNKLAKNDDVRNRMRQAVGPQDYASYNLLINNLQKVAKTQSANSITAGKLQAQQYLEPKGNPLADQVNTKGAISRLVDYLGSKITKGMDERAIQVAQQKNFALAKAIVTPDLAQYRQAIKGLDGPGRVAATAQWVGSHLKDVTPAVASLEAPQSVQQTTQAANIASTQNTNLSQLSDKEFLKLYNQQMAKAVPKDIQRDEGLRHAAYMDTTGHKTIGYGFNMDSGIAKRVWKDAGMQKSFDDVYSGKQKISDAEANALGRVSTQIAQSDAADVYDDFPKLSQSRQAALTNLSYNLGKNSLSGLSSFNSAVNKGQWTEAVRQLLSSKYALQNPQRMREIARGLLRGV